MKRNIQKISDLPSKYKSFIVKELEQKLEKYFAKPDPEFIKNLAITLENPAAQMMENTKEDNEDYNKYLVSRLVDKAVSVFMEAAQKSAKQGDILRIVKDQDFLANPNKVHKLELTRDEALLETENYLKFSYDISVWNDIRGQFLLQTEKSDSYKTLIEEVSTQITKFLKEDEWALISSAMKMAEKRIFNEDIQFPDPLEGFDEGGLKELSPENYKKYNIAAFDLFSRDENGELFKKQFSEVHIDHRKDNHDLLSLKELSLVLSDKKKMGYFSIAPAFFAKYMPELKEVGVDALIFKVQDEKLVEIKIWKSQGREMLIGEKIPKYSPVTAATALLDSYSAQYEMTYFNEDKSDHMVDFSEMKQDYLADEAVRYYVLVDGCVSGPEWGEKNAPFSYEQASLNKVQIPAGEVFLFENRNNEPMVTRLCFTPYKPTQLHPLHQLGSAVFGSNDQTYHSTSNRPLNVANEMEAYNFYKRIQNTLNKNPSTSEVYSPCMAAFQVFFCQDEKSGVSILKSLIPENRKHLLGVLYSLYEETTWTKESEISNLIKSSFVYGADLFTAEISKLLKNLAPFTKRFLYKEYIKNNRATKEIQNTFFNDLAQSLKEGDTILSLLDQAHQDSDISTEDFNKLKKEALGIDPNRKDKKV